MCSSHERTRKVCTAWWSSGLSGKCLKESISKPLADTINMRESPLALLVLDSRGTQHRLAAPALTQVMVMVVLSLAFSDGGAYRQGLPSQGRYFSLNLLGKAASFSFVHLGTLPSFYHLSSLLSTVSCLFLLPLVYFFSLSPPPPPPVI